MKVLILYFAYCLIRSLLWLRYRITVRGLADIRKRGTSAILFLPNHPAQIDPLIMATLLFPAFRARPLAYEEQIDLPVLRVLLLPGKGAHEVGQSGCHYALELHTSGRRRLSWLRHLHRPLLFQGHYSG